MTRGRIRHGAALALMGWYLMQPQVGFKHHAITVDVNAPITHWLVHETFNTADDCYFERDTEAQTTKDLWPSYPWQKGAFKQNAEGSPEWEQVTTTAAAQCVASDDPRLKD